MDKKYQAKNGRPTASTQIQIQKIIRPYFERGVSAATTARKTGVNSKTVCKYFQEWAEQVNEFETGDFLERQKVERGRIIATFDEQILEAHRYADKLDVEIEKSGKQGKGTPRHLFALRLDVMKYISDLTEKRGSFTMQPVFDDALRQKILEMVRKHGKNG